MFLVIALRSCALHDMRVVHRALRENSVTERLHENSVTARAGRLLAFESR